MLHNVVAGIVALGVISVGSWASYVAVSSTAALARAERNASYMDVAMNSVIGSAISTDGIIALPAPSADGSLPAWLGAPAKSPWGKAIRYCPYGQGSGGAASTINGYQIGTLTLASRDYVVSSDSPPVADTAFVLVSGLPGYDAPDCADVVYASGVWSVPAGSVRGVPATAVAVAKGGSAVMHVSPTGNGTGMSSSDPASLSDAIAWWQAARPSVLLLSMAPGAYTAPSSPVDDGRGGRIAFKGAASITGDLSLPADLSFDAITLTGTLTVPQGRRATVSGGSIGIVNVYGDVIVTTGTVGSLIAASGGRASVSGGTVGTVDARTAGSVTLAGGAAVTSSFADSGGRVTASSGATAGAVTVGPGGMACTQSGATYTCL